MYSTLYWLTRLNAIHGICVALTFIFGIGLICCLVIGLPECGESGDKEAVAAFLKCGKRFAIGLIIPLIGLLFIPTKEDAILIYAGGKAYDYIKSDTSLQKLPYATTEYLRTVLEREIKEAKEQASK